MTAPMTPEQEAANARLYNDIARLCQECGVDRSVSDDGKATIGTIGHTISALLAMVEALARRVNVLERGE
jgi:uncharacterized protein (DUF983 family)